MVWPSTNWLNVALSVFHTLLFSYFLTGLPKQLGIPDLWGFAAIVVYLALLLLAIHLLGNSWAQRHILGFRPVKPSKPGRRTDH